jgi:GT2 family glycosyltransferase
VLILNNDTTIDPHCLERLVTLLDRDQTIGILTPTIRYYDQPNRIWNCGGRLTHFGHRRYYCFNQIEESTIDDSILPITFITGCAFFIRTSILRKYGLFTEKFFFGEEDYEYSLRMKKVKVQIASVRSAVVYHKQSVTQNTVFKTNMLAKNYIYYLNRFINLKSYYPYLYWYIWRYAALGYIMVRLSRKHRFSFSQRYRFGRYLLRHSERKDRVTRSDFFHAVELFRSEI